MTKDELWTLIFGGAFLAIAIYLAASIYPWPWLK